MFIEAIKNMNDTEFQKMCRDIKFFSWQNHFLSDKRYTNNPFAIPSKLRSNFWINGIDDEYFFVYEPFPNHPDAIFIHKNSNTVDDFIAAIKDLSQHQFDLLCKNIIQSHYFAYKVSGMAGTDLPERIPSELKEHFCKMDLDAGEVPLLEPTHTGGFLLKTRPGLVFQDCAHLNGYSKRKLIDKLECMSKAKFKQFTHQSALVIYLYFSSKDSVFSYAYHAIPKQLRMYFRYFDIREKAFTQRLDEYFGDNEPNNQINLD